MTTPISTTVDSPLGTLTLTGLDGFLTGVSMNGQRHAPRPLPGTARDDGWFAEVTDQLHAYFAGDLTRFEVPLALGGTDFQRRVWAELREIPYGETISYGELAHRVGNPKASRAVGLANSRNPIAVIIPCHRVIGADGTLTGYGGGLERKTWLLELEMANRGRSS